MEDIVKKMAESPAKLVDEVGQVAKVIPKQKPIRIVNKYWGTLGPGLTSGASGDDPSGIATYSQAGAMYGFQMIWLSLYTTPFMIVIQEMCARLAQVSGRGIAGVMKKHYSKRLLYFTVGLIFVANTIGIGADIGGMVAATRLLIPLPYWVLAILFTSISLILLIQLSYKIYSNILKYLTLILFAYVVTALFISTDWREVVVRTFIPSLSFSRESVIMLTAIVGATISPYLLFWQASQEIEQEREAGKKTLAELKDTTDKDIKKMRSDVSTGMIFSNIIMFFIIAVTGALLFSNGTIITTAADAAQALEPFAGKYATLLFALGVIGTGMLALPVLAGSSSYAFAEAFSLSQGLDKTLKQAYGFYGVIIIAMFLGLLMNFVGIDPIQALIFAAIINGLVTPVLVTIILLACNNPKIMGQWKNGAWSNTLGWLITGIMYIAGIATIIFLFM